MTETEHRKGRGNRLIALLLFLIFLALVALIFLFWRLLSMPNPSITYMIPDGYTSNVQVGVAPDKADADIQAELNRQTAEGIISFKLNSSPIFVDGAAQGDLNLECPGSNLHGLKFIIRLDTGETVYDSGYLAPGTYIEMDRLFTAAPLAAGRYPCTVDVLLVDEESSAELGRVQAAMVITIQS